MDQANKPNRFFAVSELLALVLCKVRETENPARDEQKVIIDWAKAIREAVRRERIVGLDPHSHFFY